MSKKMKKKINTVSQYFNFVTEKSGVDRKLILAMGRDCRGALIYGILQQVSSSQSTPQQGVLEIPAASPNKYPVQNIQKNGK